MNQPIIALDVGDKRIGVAVSDPTQTLATPRSAIPRNRAQSQILKLSRDENASLIIVGMPYLASGCLGTQADKTQQFIASLTKTTGLNIETVDERLSTIEARKRLHESPGRKNRIKKDKGLLDSASAAVLLQTYLDQIGTR
ncbi:MAG: Holliday junction resolvase RuvX [Chloroflexota bacterium]|nr:Holliday junction resolvase RuvX [Chloroflexota bacterium]